MAKKTELSYEEFREDIKNHQLKIIHDDGLHRHLLVSEPGTGCYHYRVTTWPGYLSFSGDMGCFVFERTRDMFELFRRSIENINFGYLNEKLIAAGRNGDDLEYDREAFESVVKDYLDGWLEGNQDADPEFIDEQKYKVEALLDQSSEYNDESHSRFLVHDFSPDEGGVTFEDFQEHSFTRYTHKFLWCCFAIVHAVHLYDSEKTTVPQKEIMDAHT